MKKQNKLNLEDIQKALKLIKDRPDYHTVYYEWGWVKYNHGQAIEMGLNEETHQMAKDFCNISVNAGELKKNNMKIGEFMGVPIIITDEITKDEARVIKNREQKRRSPYKW